MRIFAVLINEINCFFPVGKEAFLHAIIELFDVSGPIPTARILRNKWLLELGRTNYIGAQKELQFRGERFLKASPQKGIITFVNT